MTKVGSKQVTVADGLRNVRCRVVAKLLQLLSLLTVQLIHSVSQLHHVFLFLNTTPRSFNAQRH